MTETAPLDEGGAVTNQQATREASRKGVAGSALFPMMTVGFCKTLFQDQRTFRQHEQATDGRNGQVEGIECRLNIAGEGDAGKTDQDKSTHT